MENEMTVYTWEDFQIPNQDQFEPSRTVYYTEERNEMQMFKFSVPKGKKDFPTVIFIHGGGLTGDGREWPEYIYCGDYAVAEVRHRLCPGTSPLDILSDAARAVAAAWQIAETSGGSTKNIFVGGMSAGAYLAAMVCMNPDYLKEFGRDLRKLAGLLLVSGQMTAHFYLKEMLKYPHPERPFIDAYAPLSCVSKDLPPILLVTGESGLDIPGRPEENAFMAATLRSLGHGQTECYNLSGHGHGDVLLASSAMVRNFIGRYLKK